MPAFWNGLLTIRAGLSFVCVCVSGAAITDTPRNPLTNILHISQSNHQTININHHGIRVAVVKFEKYLLDWSHRLKHPKDGDAYKRVLSAAGDNLRGQTGKTFQHQMDRLIC